MEFLETFRLHGDLDAVDNEMGSNPIERYCSPKSNHNVVVSMRLVVLSDKPDFTDLATASVASFACVSIPVQSQLAIGR